uniref:Uncharacterized protein B11A5.010 n=1 Tax=Neurospora crassa TaxID=5141 RepID=Q96UA8_NEUCS|nr:putative protein [Neurospora crassa]
MALPQQKWRRGTLGWSFGALATFVINLTLMLYAVLGADADPRTGLRHLGSGMCSNIHNIDIGVHVVINALSTVLLAGSNYCMQCASAPTRNQIDQAHRAKRWLDVGRPSLRNFRSLGLRNATLWVLLAVSSLPLHLFYNSVVFSSTTANIYNVWSLNEGILNATDWEHLLEAENPDAYTGFGLNYTVSNFHAGLFMKLPVEQCINVYAQPFQSSWGDVILISNDAARGPALGRFETEYIERYDICSSRQAYQWVCGQYDQAADGACVAPCDETLPEVLLHVDNWQPYGLVVEYCYARPTPETCSLYFSTTLGIVVLVLNLTKAVLMALVTLGPGSPLLTIGDAIASFLKVPDEATAGMCLASKRHFTAGTKGGKRERRGRAASLFRWIACIMAYVIGLATCGWLMKYGLSKMLGKKSMSYATSLGFGAVSEKTLISNALFDNDEVDPLLGNVILVNTPQLILSDLYFTYNDLFTSMCAAVEWSRFAIRRKGLRVSDTPTGSQRSTYFLQLPYRYSLPLMVVSGTLHLFVSQSIFLVYVEAAGDPVVGSWLRGDTVATSTGIFPYEGKSITCGWSPLGVLCTICLGTVVVLFLVLWSFRRLPSGMPVVANCSAAVAAACHPKPWEDGAWEKPLMWGVTKLATSEKLHCSFSTEDVVYPLGGTYQ